MSREPRHQLYYDIFDSPLGPFYIEFSEKFLTRISYQKPSDIPFKGSAAPESFKKELASYFDGTGTGFNQEIKLLIGTDFEKKVWDSLREIPFGETRTYKWVAEKIGNPSAVRAVGRALSKNPVPIVIPCHRVIESDGSIGGYSLGVDIKRRLLDIEFYSKINKG
ncbi:MAG TPA: methylated-DNA--[protein]-cysteine S-methyltransferase [Nitrospirae bacterium]|nr:methylated-DNA--[protein]-cysteine S-methyltransferase [Nitrospirota bacterium]